MAAGDRKEQTRRAVQATEPSKGEGTPEVDARVEHAQHLRAARGRATSQKAAKAADSRATRERDGANHDRGNKSAAAVDEEAKDEDEDEDKDKDKDEDKAAAHDLFWKNLVWGAYRSRKRRGED